ncbi:MAG: PolC-type DNA polymerase III, partial [Tissierellia bacterium]|nr:PolC-type DNA polymerase III [Tissierellia bacterium]
LKEEDIYPVICGELFSVELKGTSREDLYIGKMYMYDGTESILVKSFVNEKDVSQFKQDFYDGQYMILSGEQKYDKFEQSMSVFIREYKILEKPEDFDDALAKRVEIHAHTKMSLLAGTIDPLELVHKLKKWGHRGFCLTDLSCVQAYPDVMYEADDNFKIVYGMEAVVFDDEETFIQGSTNNKDEFVVFDIESTGLDPHLDEVIEIGAVKIKEGQIVDTFSQLYKATKPLSPFITNLTKITDDMIKNESYFMDSIEEFSNFIGDAVLVAHNADFDIGFLKQKFKQKNKRLSNAYLDTLKLSRYVLTDLKRFRLNLVCERLGIPLDQHHRAIFDAKATAQVFLELTKLLKKNGEIQTMGDLSKVIYPPSFEDFHVLLYVKNQEGLKDLYKLVTKSHIETFNRVPKIPLSEIRKAKDSFIIGSEGLKGQIMKKLQTGFTFDDLEQEFLFYDFVELQPLDHYLGLLKDGRFKDLNGLIEFLKQMVFLCEEKGMKIISGGNVYEMTAENQILRKILAKSRGDFRAENEPPLYLKDTKTMLEGYKYLPDELAKKYVIDHTNQLLDSCDQIRPIPSGKFPPIVEGSDEVLRKTCFERAKSIYGDPLPEIVENRLNKELDSIIKNGYSVMYTIAKDLVAKSEEDGYLVGSRGSVGSSFAATMSGITEVNPLPAHYVCPSCKHSIFYENSDFDAGVDMPDKNCPKCNFPMRKDGYTIPFETFLGFTGEKEPDIDLNFAGEYQTRAHEFIEELFGNGYVFRAGTIGTIQDKIGFGYVKNYFEENNQTISKGEMNRLIRGLVGVKKTTGQHPGGIMIVPKNKDIHDFSPVQHPADDKSSGVYTTHFAYKAIHSNILKLDILGHDGPTMIKLLEDYTGRRIEDIHFDDSTILSLFSSPKALGISEEDLNCPVGTLGIPEFGTDFVRSMLTETKPKNFSDLIRISGLSHGTNVWINNAQELVKNGTCELKDVIATREDIMTYLLKAGLPNDFSFFTMEKVRKGKPLSEDEMSRMLEHDLPEWYIDSCNKIEYMFPKAHAVAYVMLSFRIAWYKVHYPEAFYATFFSTKKTDFDYSTISKGLDEIERAISSVTDYRSLTAKEKGTYRLNELAREMYLRGIECAPIDLYQSNAFTFAIKDHKIIPPLVCVPNLGDQVAENIVAERQKGAFISIEDLATRTKMNKTCIQFLQENNILRNMQETNQMSMF